MPRVDFKKLKERVLMPDVLRHLGLWERFSEKKGAYYGPCPLGDAPGSHGQPFKATKDGKAWYCFACKKGGNVLDLVVAYKGSSLRQAGVTLAEWFPEQRSARDGAPTPSDQAGNAPLTFELKLDHEHPFFAEQGITPPVVESFGVGYASRGLMKGTIAFPTHNATGDLVAYAGRSLEDGSYRFPDGFERELEVFNIHRVTGLSHRDDRTDVLVVVDDPLACLHATECGFPRVVALLDRTLTPTQRALLGGICEETRPRIVLMLPTFSAEEQMAIVGQLLDIAFVTRCADLSAIK